MVSEAELRRRLDKRYAQLLKAIAHHGGTATTTQIKAYMGIETNQVITQRLDVLADLDLVTCSYRRTSENPQQMPTKTGTLTVFGEQVTESPVVEDLLRDSDRVEGVSELNQTTREHRRRLEALAERVEDLEGRVSDLEAIDPWA